MSEERATPPLHGRGGASRAEGDDGGAGTLDDPRALQILSTEHWSLLATRSLIWSESFSRTGLFLSVLSACVVALGLVGGATGFDQEFAVFALALLPVALFVGLATFVRLDEVNLEDAYWVAAMNRIRHAYLEATPGLEQYFTSGWTDDTIGIARTFAMTRRPTPANTFIHQFVTTPGMVAVINGALAAAISGIAASAISGPGMTSPLAIGLAAGIITTAILMWTTVRRARRVMATWEERFPLEGPPKLPLVGVWSGSSARGSRQDGGGEPRA